MGAYLFGRLQHMFIVLLAVSMLVFLLVHLSGDPAKLMAPLDATTADMERIAKLHGLDKPIWQQYTGFITKAVQGDLGKSFKYGQDAMSLVVGRLPATLTLAVSATLLAVLVSVPFGVMAGSKPDRPIDLVVSFFSFLCISLPSFWLGILLILLFADVLRWVPPSGRGTLSQMVLPTLTLALYSIGLLTRLIRSSMIETLHQDYIRTARAKGLTQRVVLYKHALKNCLIPAVTVIGLQMGALLGGSVVVEAVFAWPGVGWLMLQGIQGRDIPLVRAIVLTVGALFVLINLVVDLAYGYLDPRIRYQ